MKTATDTALPSSKSIRSWIRCMAIRDSRRLSKKYSRQSNEDRLLLRTERTWAPTLNQMSNWKIGHVLFIDLVGYSKLLLDEQRELQHQLTRLVRNTEQCAPRKRWATDSASRQQWFFTNNY